jgi:hypothetical protein
MAGPIPQRFLVPDEFKHCALWLRVWNVWNVASNIFKVNPATAVKYLDMNTTPEDLCYLTVIAHNVQLSRHPLFDLYTRHSVQDTCLVSILNSLGGADVYQQRHEERTNGNKPEAVT